MDVRAQFLRKLSTHLRKTAGIQRNLLQRRHWSRAKKDLPIALEQTNAVVDLSVHGCFLKVVPGNVPALKMPRVHGALV